MSHFVIFGLSATQSFLILGCRRDRQLDVVYPARGILLLYVIRHRPRLEFIAFLRYSVSNLPNGLDLDGRVQRQCVGPKCGARRQPGIAKYLAK